MDISMCSSTICPLRSSCYRNACSGTKANKYMQSYFMFDETNSHYKDFGIETDECHYYWRRDR